MVEIRTQSAEQTEAAAAALAPALEAGDLLLLHGGLGGGRPPLGAAWCAAWAGTKMRSPAPRSP